MSASTKAPVSPPVAAGPRSQTFGERLSKLPEELIIHILEYTLVLPGAISRKDFWGGKCEWPSCLCEDSDWEHIPGEELTNQTLVPLLATPKPVPRLAKYVFYRSNTFHVCDPHSDMTWTSRGVWLPPQGVRHWIRRLEVEIQIENPRGKSLAYATWKSGRDVVFLRRMQQAVEEFMELRTLRLMFEAVFVTEDAQLQILDQNWSTLDPFHFQTLELILEACSAYPVWCDDSEPSGEGDIVRDERLERLLAKYVSATGSMQCIGGKGDWTGRECHRWHGQL